MTTVSAAFAAWFVGLALIAWMIQSWLGRLELGRGWTKAFVSLLIGSALCPPVVLVLAVVLSPLAENRDVMRMPEWSLTSAVLWPIVVMPVVWWLVMVRGSAGDQP